MEGVANKTMHENFFIQRSEGYYQNPSIPFFKRKKSEIYGISVILRNLILHVYLNDQYIVSESKERHLIRRRQLAL